MRLSPRQPGHSSFKPHARLINTSSRTSWMMGASAPPRSMPPAPHSEGPLGGHTAGAVAPARTHALARRSLANRQPPQRQTKQALARAAQLARTVHASGGTFFFEARPASTAWNDPELQHTLQACGCVLARVPFCAHGLDLHGAWLLASNEPETSTLGHTCQHPLGTHRVQLLKRKHEPASSRETALHYPASLCQAVLALVKNQVSTGELARIPLQPLPASPSVGPACILRPSLCDGAGMHSTIPLRAPRLAACSPFATPGSRGHTAWTCPNASRHTSCRACQSTPSQRMNASRPQPWRTLACTRTAIRPNASALRQTSPSDSSYTATACHSHQRPGRRYRPAHAARGAHWCLRPPARQQAMAASRRYARRRPGTASTPALRRQLEARRGAPRGSAGTARQRNRGRFRGSL